MLVVDQLLVVLVVGQLFVPKGRVSQTTPSGWVEHVYLLGCTHICDRIWRPRECLFRSQRSLCFVHQVAYISVYPLRTLAPSEAVTALLLRIEPVPFSEYVFVTRMHVGHGDEVTSSLWAADL